MTTTAARLDTRHANRAGNAKLLNPSPVGRGAGVRVRDRVTLLSQVLRPIRRLHLAAAPTFAAMALLNLLVANPADILCSAGHGVASLGGMTLMYALMSVFHASPWLKLVASRRGRRARRHIDVVLAVPDPKSVRVGRSGA